LKWTFAQILSFRKYQLEKDLSGNEIENGFQYTDRQEVGQGIIEYWENGCPRNSRNILESIWND
jgi:hypothetical protein